MSAIEKRPQITDTCEWCGESAGSATEWWESAKEERLIHNKCYAVMYNYARRFQELKELLMQPDIVEVNQS